MNIFKAAIILFLGLYLSGCASSKHGPISHSKISKVPLNTQLYHRGPYGSAKFLRSEFKISKKRDSRYVARLYEAYEDLGPWANFIDVYDMKNSGKLVCSVLVGSSEQTPQLRDRVCLANNWIPKPYRKGGSKKFKEVFLQHFEISESGCREKRVPQKAQGCWSIAESSEWEHWLK